MHGSAIDSQDASVGGGGAADADDAADADADASVASGSAVAPAVGAGAATGSLLDDAGEQAASSRTKEAAGQRMPLRYPIQAAPSRWIETRSRTDPASRRHCRARIAS